MMFLYKILQMFKSKKNSILVILFFLISCTITAQQTITSRYLMDDVFSKSLEKIIHNAGLDSSYNVGEDGFKHISFAVIDLTGKKPVLGGVHYNNFIYPASVYKMYVAMEVLKQVNEGKYSLYTPYVIKAHNEVDKISEINYDPRPLLKAGDTVTINYLLDLMITRSDNTAANCMIDIAGRKQINTTIQSFYWNGSEVTRKFLKRKFEDPGYDTIKGTETCALHAADFMNRIYNNKLVDPWVSMQLKSLLGRQLDTTKLSTGLPKGAMFYHKTGWWSYYTHDVGIVDDGFVKYIIALFVPLTEDQARPKMKEISEKIYALIKQRHNH